MLVLASPALTNSSHLALSDTPKIHSPSSATQMLHIGSLLLNASIWVRAIGFSFGTKCIIYVFILGVEQMEPKSLVSQQLVCGNVPVCRKDPTENMRVFLNLIILPWENNRVIGRAITITHMLGCDENTFKIFHFTLFLLLVVFKFQSLELENESSLILTIQIIQMHLR